MAIDWDKKKHALRWGTGCGFFYFIYQAFLEDNVFNGKNRIWEDILLSAVCVLSPIILVFLFYWPVQRAGEEGP